MTTETCKDDTCKPELSAMERLMATSSIPKKEKLDVKGKLGGTVPYFEADCMDRPSGMTEAELNGFSQYGQRYETNESLVWNDLYGHSRVLKNWSGYGGTIPGVIPHGTYSTFLGLSGMELCTGLPNYYSWLSYVDQHAKVQGPYNVIPIAAPFIYAMATLRYDRATKGEGTIFIPYHSTDIWDFDDDWYHLMIALRKAKYPQPLAVMLFFEDVRKGRHRIFQKKGIPVYTCGEKFRPDFLYQFIHIVRHFDNVLINDISTPTFYGAFMGKNIITHGEGKVRYENAHAPWRCHSPNGRAFPDGLYEAFIEPNPNQLNIAADVLRSCAFQFPQQMKDMFEGKEIHYASEKGKVEEDCLGEHPEADGRGDAPETGGGGIAIDSGEIKEAQEEESDQKEKEVE